MEPNELKLECLRLAQADARASNDISEHTGEGIVKRARQYAEFIDPSLVLPYPSIENKEPDTR